MASLSISECQHFKISSHGIPKKWMDLDNDNILEISTIKETEEKIIIFVNKIL